MAALRDIELKIKAIKKIQQITRAMNMVASAKLRNTQARMEKFRPYANKFNEVLENLASRIDSEVHPLMIKMDEIHNTALLHFTSDRGLCGSFNINNIHEGEKWIREQEKAERGYSLTVIGKKGRDYFKKRSFNISESYVQIYGEADISFINNLTKGFIEGHERGEIDELYMIYSRFINMAKQEPVLVKLIPIEPPVIEDSMDRNPAEYLCEPDAEKLLIDLLPKHLSVQILNAFLQNEVSEHAARMAAMDNSTRNCKDMVEELTLLYNKARQSAITLELMDIVGGAAAISN